MLVVVDGMGYGRIPAHAEQNVYYTIPNAFAKRCRRMRRRYAPFFCKTWTSQAFINITQYLEG